jgi:phytoene dehydrogenase-like protein
MTRDVVIIGAGHNSLVAAFYLAKAGRKPLVLEARPVVGGSAVTEEFHPGFRCSTLLHACGPLRPAVLRDMGLEKSVAWLRPDPCVFVPHPDGRALVLHHDAKKSAESIAAFSRYDAGRYVEFSAMLARMGAAIARLLDVTPPDIDDPSFGDLFDLIKTGREFRSLGQKDMFRLLRYGPMAVADLVAEWFETELLRAVVAARGVFGTAMGPWSAGSSATLLLRAASDAHPAGTLVVPRGGMGALTQAMANAARKAGAEIRISAPVARITVQNGRACGVVLASGEEIAAKAVVSGADPKRTLLGLLDPVHLEPNVTLRLRNYRCSGTVAKVNLALDGLPRFAALNGDSRSALSGRIHIGHEIDYLERAFDASKYGEFSAKAYLEVVIPTLADPSLAPDGKHVVSIFAHFAPYRLRAGDWNAHRDALGHAVVDTLAAYAPDLPGHILARQVLTPLDLEEKFGLTGGHLFHGELALDQLFTMRPVLDWARYRTPVAGLYLCGSGTHPGTGLTGASGANAAREILRDKQ